MGAHPFAAAVSAGLAVVVVGWALWERRAERDDASVLPLEIERLAWRADESTVAFAWRFRKERKSRVRILRSGTGFADRRSARHDQTTIFDAEGDSVVDHTVSRRRTYYYTFLVERPLREPASVHLEILTVLPDERARIEATSAPMSIPWDGGRDALATAVRHGAGSDQAAAAVLGEILGGVASTAVFAVAELFAAERLPEEWVEVE